jgi:hypothetical protein
MTLSATRDLQAFRSTTPLSRHLDLGAAGIEPATSRV